MIKDNFIPSSFEKKTERITKEQEALLKNRQDKKN